MLAIRNNQVPNPALNVPNPPPNTPPMITMANTTPNLLDQQHLIINQQLLLTILIYQMVG
jgi:hypothetical protein